jgi:hypothetical protein
MIYTLGCNIPPENKMQRNWESILTGQKKKVSLLQKPPSREKKKEGGGGRVSVSYTR